RVAGVAALGLRVTSTCITSPRRCFARWTAPWECSATMALPWSDACSLGICGVWAATSVGTAHTAASPKSVRTMRTIQPSLRRHEVGRPLERGPPAGPLPRQQHRTGAAAGDLTEPGCNRRVGGLDEAGGAEPDVCERLGDYRVRFSGVDHDAIGERVHAGAVTLLELAGDATDSEVVRAVLGGEVERYAVWVRRYRDRYARYAARMLGSLDAGEDAVQDALVRAFDRLADCREPDKFAGWLFLILRNRCYAERRRQQREGRPLDERDDGVAAADRPEGTVEQTERI